MKVKADEGIWIGMFIIRPILVRRQPPPWKSTSGLVASMLTSSPPFTASSLSTLADALLAGLFLIIYLHPVSHASARVIPYTRTS